MFVNFMKYSFNECMKRLQNELVKLNNNNVNDTQVNKSVAITVKSSINKTQSIENWSENEVQDWLSKNNLINPDIKNILINFNGKMLSNLNSIRLTAPDYYFTAISKNNTIDLFSVVNFNQEFSNLFK